MPQIPVLREGQRLNVSSPVPISSTGSERMAGESLSALGAGITNAGASMTEFFGRTNQINRKLDVDAFANEAERIAQERRDWVRKNGKADGSDHVQLFSDDFDSKVKKLSESVDDPVTRRDAVNHANQIRNRYTGQLYTESFDKTIKNAESKLQQNLSALTANVFRDPDQAAASLVRYLDSLDSVGRLGLYTPENIDKAKNAAIHDIADQAIHGRVARGEFGIAREELTTRWASNFDEKKRNDLRKFIDDSEYTFSERQFREEDRQHRENERILKQVKEENSTNLIGKVIGAKDSAERQGALRLADQLMSQGLIDKTDYNFASSIATKEITASDERATTHILERIVNGEPSDKMLGTIHDAHEAGEISSKNAQELYRYVKTQREKRQSDPAFRRLESAAKEILDSQFGKDFLNFTMSKEQRILKSQAVVEYTRMVNSGSDPVSAANATVKKYLPGIQQLPMVPGVPYSDQFDKKGLRDAAKELKRKKDNKEITSGAYLHGLSLIEQRMKVAPEYPSMSEKGQ